MLDLRPDIGNNGNEKQKIILSRDILLLKTIDTMVVQEEQALPFEIKLNLRRQKNMNKDYTFYI